MVKVAIVNAWAGDGRSTVCFDTGV